MTITEEQQQASEGGAGVPAVASRARDWARNAPNQVAFREKDFGIWNEYTWADSWEMIEKAANGLLALGVQPGDRVSIHSEDRLEWIIMDLATVAVRGVTVGFYPTNPTAEVEYLLTDCGACIHFAEDQEQYDKVLDIGREKLSALRKIIFAEPRGMVGQDDDR
ncbi:MAG: AMP-binding protein, partial [Ilumatobacteraceae bacterium]